MKQVSRLPIAGKKMTKAAMKALKGGSTSGGCVDAGWVCPGGNCCYEDYGECSNTCPSVNCIMAICPIGA